MLANPNRHKSLANKCLLLSGRDGSQLRSDGRSMSSAERRAVAGPQQKRGTLCRLVPSFFSLMSDALDSA